MSYKKIEDIQYLYENVDGKESDIEDLSNLIVEKLISEGYSENAIHSFMETADEFALQEKIMQLDEKDLGKVQKGLELLRKFGSRFIRKKPQQLNLNLGSKSSALDKGKEVVKKGVEVVKKNPKTSAVVGTSTLVGTSVATSNRGNNKDTNTDTETKAKPGTFKDSQGKEFPTTDTIRGTTRKELSTKRDPIINRRGRTTGYTKSEKDLENEKIDKQVDKYVADKKAPINKDLTIDKSAEGKAKYAEKAAERIAKETPKVDPKPVKMSNLERQNRARFGDAAIDKLKAKQVDFKKMQANSQLPGADRGAEKAKFIKKYPNSITAQKAAGLRDHYDPEEVAIDENRMASHTAGMSDAQKDAATSSVSRSTADKMGRRSDEAAFKGRKKKTSARYSSTSGKKRKNTTGRGQPEQYRKSADSPENEGRYPYGRSRIVQGKGSFKGLKKEEFENIQELDNMGGPAAIGAVIAAGAGLTKSAYDAIKTTAENLKTNKEKKQQKIKNLTQSYSWRDELGLIEGNRTRYKGVGLSGSGNKKDMSKGPNEKVGLDYSKIRANAPVKTDTKVG